MNATIEITVEPIKANFPSKAIAGIGIFEREIQSIVPGLESKKLRSCILRAFFDKPVNSNNKQIETATAAIKEPLELAYAYPSSPNAARLGGPAFYFKVGNLIALPIFSTSQQAMEYAKKNDLAVSNPNFGK